MDKQVSRPASPPILLTGLRNIAAALGVSGHALRNNFLTRQDFPVFKGRGTNSPWITTRPALEDWAKNLSQGKFSKD